MRTLILALLLATLPPATLPLVGGTPQAYKKYSRAEVIKVYGKPLSQEMKAMVRQAKTRLEAAKILLEIYLDTHAKLAAELRENGEDLARTHPDLVRRAVQLHGICEVYAVALAEVVDYFSKVDGQ